jgi:hypothetical protein
MASSRPEPATAIAFALQELEACWTQAYEALARGDLDGVGTLLDEADRQVAVAGGGGGVGRMDDDATAALRGAAQAAYGRLQHAMRAGMDGLREEIGRTRRGAKVLRGYGHGEAELGGRVTKDA